MIFISFNPEKFDNKITKEVRCKFVLSFKTQPIAPTLTRIYLT